MTTGERAEWSGFCSNTGIKSFSIMILCGTQRILGQKVSTKSCMAAVSLSPLCEYCYYLLLSSNIRVKGKKMKRENNPIRPPLQTWCSLTVPQCAASNKGNKNSWYLCLTIVRHLLCSRPLSNDVSVLLLNQPDILLVPKSTTRIGQFADGTYRLSGPERSASVTKLGNFLGLGPFGQMYDSRSYECYLSSSKKGLRNSGFLRGSKHTNDKH